jgi:hypothetical protein
MCDTRARRNEHLGNGLAESARTAHHERSTPLQSKIHMQAQPLR